ncbi:MAG TPA: ThiF family adenylyltransferase [Armatimonadota bacterium]|jgi:molybdopterin/thiamine biosynthesis adenylyltransferase
MEAEIRLRGSQYEELGRLLLTRRDVESKGFVLCGRAEGKRRTLLLGREVVPVPETAYAERSRTRVVTSEAFVGEILDRCEAEGLSLLEAHSHPWTEAPRFSGIDDASDTRKFRATKEIPPPFRHATAVFGRDLGFEARIYDPSRRRAIPVGALTVLEAPLRFRRPSGAPQGSLSARQAAVFERQVRAFGEVGQAILGGLAVAVVGGGGLGSQIVQGLGLLGVGRLLLIDPDRLEASNANRQVLVTARQVRAGEGKVRALSRGLEALCPAVGGVAMEGDVRERACWAHLLDADIVVGAVDSHAVRHFVNALCACALLPFVDAGVGVRAEGGRIAAAGGQVRTVVPGVTPCLACLDKEAAERSLEEQTAEQHALSERAGYIRGERIPAPQVAFLNGVVASALVWEVVKLATGCLPTAPYVYYDLTQPAMWAVEEGERRDDCLVCSPAGLLGSGTDGILGLGTRGNGSPPPLPGRGGKETVDGYGRDT